MEHLRYIDISDCKCRRVRFAVMPTSLYGRKEALSLAKTEIKN